MFDILPRLELELQQLKALGQLRELHIAHERGQGATLIRGRRAIDFTDWDFLGLHRHPRVVRAVVQEIEQSGFGSSGARLSSGTTSAHQRCEVRLAQFFGCESALLFSSKSQAVFSLITALSGERDVVIAAENIQCPVFDAAQLVNASTAALPLLDFERLEPELERWRAARSRIVVVEALSPVTGMPAPLERIKSLCDRFDALLVVDETYAVGAMGQRGAGGIEEAGLTARGMIVVCGFGAGIPGYGATVAGMNVVIGYLLNRSRTFLAEGALPPPIAAGVERCLDLLELDLVGRDLLRARALEVRAGLGNLGWLLDPDRRTPVISIPCARPQAALELQTALFHRNILVDVVSAQLHLSEASFVRLCLRTAHNNSTVETTLQAMADLRTATPKL